MSSSRKQETAGATPKWLSVVGIGEDGAAGLGDAARSAIMQAEFVFGATRHLELAAGLISGEARAWPAPFDSAMAAVLALRSSRVCVLASGDPFNHGVGATLARHLSASEMDVHPAPSAFTLAASRLGWPLQDVETVSLHGRDIALLRPLLQPGRRVLALTSDGAAPAAIANRIVSWGFGLSRLHILEALGGPSERVLSGNPAVIAGQTFAPLNLLAIEVAAGADAAIVPLGFGLDDALFEHDGQITKREVRALTLSALCPRRGELLWDIGAGAGSIAIEWMLTHPSMRAVAIEADAERAARIGRNATALGVPGINVVHGRAPEALAGLPAPDAIFVGGGGGSGDGVTEAAIGALRPGGRLVANAVTLAMEALLLSLHASHGGALTRIAISRAAPVGEMRGWRPAMPVTQWSWTRT